MISIINEFEPDYLFVGMTASKQEKMGLFPFEKIRASKIFSVGAAFDWYAEVKKDLQNFGEN